MPKISIIIRSYNEEQHIGRLLHGLEMQNMRDFEIILVDSGSTDSTVPIAERYGVQIVRIPKAEFSFGRALNLGCAVAKGEFLLFASAHVYPLRRDWLERIIAPFEDSSIAISYGRQVGNEVTRFSEHEVFKSWFPAQSVRHQAHNFCNNANCAVRRSLWEQQHYDETLTGLEDLAWAKGVRTRGGQIAYVAEAVIAHVHQETWSRVRNRYRREAIALRTIEPVIRFSFVDFLSLTVRNVASDMKTAAQMGRLRHEAAGIVLFRLNQFLGTWLGHRDPDNADAELRSRFYYPTTYRRDHNLQSSLDIDYRQTGDKPTR
ncbi:glycosyltransferase [Paragemmobacter straminiformis]|uniref:Glycosyltransferase family 2 protein n=1 Tax=Paragemmobacter straminiformis TaxID=2045119 RepID=A0A842I6X3_9RHOB|nr:glycosyltransferase family 2 protein [Gemmobacter straminiformis]MBC2835117.1 glycosyltransferase family 2 protein [Gemmobacter straminiformis]